MTDAVVDFLSRQGLLDPGAKPVLTPLTGGVSSDLWQVDLPSGPICVKGALSRLKVATPWFAPVSRNRVECDWLRFAHRLRPGQVPRVIAHDAQAGFFAMEYLEPSRYPVWKARLLCGEVDAASARAVGELVGHLHSASARDPAAATRFATDDNFDALRIGPYLRMTARAHEDLAGRFAELAERTAGVHLAVVHAGGALGPNGPVLLDAECAWFGDPAFDLAFCLNHLLIKSVKLPQRAAALRTAARALADGHAAHIDWESPAGFTERVTALLPALTLARVDGSSPVEYLDTRQRATVRATGRELLRAPSANPEDLLARWAALADRPGASVS